LLAAMPASGKAFVSISTRRARPIIR
jgi:hypothetical protein